MAPSKIGLSPSNGVKEKPDMSDGSNGDGHNEYGDNRDVGHRRYTHSSNCTANIADTEQEEQ